MMEQPQQAVLLLLQQALELHWQPQSTAPQLADFFSAQEQVLLYGPQSSTSWQPISPFQRMHFLQLNMMPAQLW
jgi:hypothetical protein